MTTQQIGFRVAAIVAIVALATVSTIAALGVITQNANAGNSANANGGDAKHIDVPEVSGTTGAYAMAYVQTSTQNGVTVTKDAWAFDGNTLTADKIGYHLGTDWAWSTEFDIEARAIAVVTGAAAQTDPPTTYYCEGRAIVELNDIYGNWGMLWFAHDEETVFIRQEDSVTQTEVVSASASFSLINVKKIKVSYDIRCYASAETDRAETFLYGQGRGGYYELCDGYMRLIDVSGGGTIVDEWILD